MTTLYKSTGRIAVTITALLVLSVSTAIAVTKDVHASTKAREAKTAEQQMASMGRFVVTPKSVTFVAPTTESIRRFVVSQHRAIFVPSQAQAKA